jgi:hypothetical protein
MQLERTEHLTTVSFAKVILSDEIPYKTVAYGKFIPKIYISDFYRIFSKIVTPAKLMVVYSCILFSCIENVIPIFLWRPYLGNVIAKSIIHLVSRIIPHDQSISV